MFCKDRAPGAWLWVTLPALCHPAGGIRVTQCLLEIQIPEAHLDLLIEAASLLSPHPCHSWRFPVLPSKDAKSSLPFFNVSLTGVGFVSSCAKALIAQFPTGSAGRLKPPVETFVLSQ